MRIAGAVFLIVLAAVLTGMGGLGGAPEGAIPETKENIRARITDRQGVSTDLERFSMDGKVFLSANRGSGTLTIPFVELRTIDFSDPAGNTIPVQTHLTGGERIGLQVDRRSVFYGSTGYGSLQIRARDLRRIEFLRDEPR